MAGKRQFTCRREDSDSSPARLPNQYEGGFRKVGLQRDRLHLLIGQRRGIVHDRQLVTSKRPLGKYIDDIDRVAGHLGSPLEFRHHR